MLILPNAKPSARMAKRTNAGLCNSVLIALFLDVFQPVRRANGISCAPNRAPLYTYLPPLEILK